MESVLERLSREFDQGWRCWVTQFRMVVAESVPRRSRRDGSPGRRDWGRILNCLAMAGICGPDEHCGCEAWMSGDWHANHVRYNTAIWLTIRAADGLGPLRRAVVRDLGRGDEEYGLVVQKAHGRRLLERFLREDPDPGWVDVRTI